MSQRFTEPGLLTGNVISHTTAAGVIDYVWSKNNPFLVLTMDAIIQTAGTVTANTLSLKSWDGATTYGSVVLGNEVAGTMLETRIADASAVFPAGTKLKLITSNTDSQVEFSYRVFGSSPAA